MNESGIASMCESEEVASKVRSIIYSVYGKFCSNDGYTSEDRDALIDAEVILAFPTCDGPEYARALWKCVQGKQLQEAREEKARKEAAGLIIYNRGNGNGNGADRADADLSAFEKLAREKTAELEQQFDAMRARFAEELARERSAIEEKARKRINEQFTGTFCSTQKGGQNGDGEQTYRVCGVGVIARMHIHGNITSLEEANRLARNVERAIATVAGVGA